MPKRLLLTLGFFGGVAIYQQLDLLQPQSEESESAEAREDPAMSQGCVVGVYENFEKVKEAVQALETSAYPSDKISLATHSVGNQLDSTKELQYGDETEKQAAVGAGVGGILGVLISAPLLAIPGLGPLLVAGPLATGLTGAIVGGFLGSMGGWGVHEDHVAKYEKQVRAGNLIVMANGTPDELAEAQRVLRQTDAIEVNLHSKTSADSPEIVDEA